MVKKSYSFYYDIILYFLTIISFLLSGYLVIGYVLKKRSIVSWARFKGINALMKASNKLNKKFSDLENIAKDLSNRLSTNNLTKEEIESILKEILLKNNNIYGVGVAYEPYAYSKKQELYAPYGMKFIDKSHKSGNSKYLQRHIEIQRKYNYTKKDWYINFINKKGQWSEPYFSETFNDYLIDYIVPVAKDGNTIGLVFVNYSFNDINDLISNLDLDAAGYGFIINKLGTYISHPLKKYIDLNVFNIAKSTGIYGLEDGYRKALEFPGGDFKYVDNITNKDFWIFNLRMPINNWTLFINFAPQEFLEQEYHVLYEYLIVVIIFVVIFLFLFSLVVTKIYKGRNLWFWSIFISLILLIAISIIWYMQIYRYSSFMYGDIVFNKSKVQKIISNYIKSSENLLNNLPNNSSKSSTEDLSDNL